jgi:hypothetical protein
MGSFMPYKNGAAQVVAAAQAAQAVAAAQTRAIQLRDASIMNWAMRRHPGDWEGTFADYYKNGGSRIGGLAQEKARDAYRQTLANSAELQPRPSDPQPRPSGRGSAQEKTPFQRQWGAALAVGKKANWDPLVTQQGVNAAMMDTMIAQPRVAARMRNAWAQTPQDPQARVKYLDGQYASTGDKSQETPAAPAPETEPRPSGSDSAPQTESRPSGSGSAPEAAPDEAAVQQEEEQ